MKRRHHLVDVRRPGCGSEIKNNWIDRDELLLMAAFAVLCDFVEKEKPFRFHYTKSRGDGKEIYALYKWWTKQRGVEFKKAQALMDECGKLAPKVIGSTNKRYSKALNKAFKADYALQKKDDRMLLRLVKIRNLLWT